MAIGTEPRELALLSQAARALAKASSFEEVLAIRDTAEAARAWAKAAKLSVKSFNLAAELKLRAERKVGEFLAEAALNGGDRRSQLHDARVKLDDLEIEPTQSHRWQRIAAVPEAEFEEHIEATKSANRELTTAGVLRLAKEQQQLSESAQRQEAAKSHGIVGSLYELVRSEVKFSTIYADPPWQYSNKSTRSNVDDLYANTMTVDEICAEPVAELVENEAHLHLWTTNAFLFDAKRVIEAWGFEYKSCFVWVKPQLGMGNYWRLSHEFLLLGVRGGLRFRSKSQQSWLAADRTKHSQKPQEVRRIIELVSPAPYLEMYGRHRLDGAWTVYGDEIEGPGMFG